MRGPGVATAWSELVARFGPLKPLGQGVEARVFADNGRVFKVYKPKERELAFKEAKNLARAGLGAWVLGVEVLEAGHGVLILRRFPGEPFAPERFDDRALASLGAFLLRLHRLPEAGALELGAVRERLLRFKDALAEIPGAPEVADRLVPRLALLKGVRPAFCHTDLWAGNVLIAADGQTFVVDWARAKGEDPARDLAILKTGSLDLLGPEAALDALRPIVRRYPEPQAIWARLAFWIPMTYLHDLYWFLTKAPEGLEEAVRTKLPLAEALSWVFPPL